VRRMRRSGALICSGCGKRVRDVVDVSEREVRDLPWGEYRTTVVVEDRKMTIERNEGVTTLFDNKSSCALTKVVKTDDFCRPSWPEG
jgi:transposase